VGLGSRAVEVMGLNTAFWARQRVLLTGHTGFKGAWASLWLERLGATVYGLSLAPDQVPDLFSQVVPFARQHSTIADVTDRDAVRRVVDAAAPTLVLHMAAQPLVRRSYAEPRLTFATNVMGTVELLDALAAQPGIAAVLIVTTDKVYRNDGGGRRFVESDALGGHDPYSASKAAAELVTAAFAASRLAAVPVATARAGNVIGGGDWSIDRLVPDAWRATRDGTTLELRYPQATRPWQHVLDSIGGYLTYLEALAERPAGLPRALNFGPADPGLTVAEIIESLAAAGMGSSWRQAPGDHPREAPALALNPAAARAALGWRTRLDAADTARWTADWYRRYDAGDNARALCDAQITAYEDLR